MKGRIADINLAEGAVLSGGTWSADLPLTNLVDRRMLSQPARCEDPTDLAKSQFTVTLGVPRSITMVAVLFNTLSLGALVRLRIATDSDFLDVIHDSGWVDVWPRLFPSTSLEWDDENWWTGRPTEADLELYPRHLWMPVEPRVLGTYLRLEFDDTENAEEFFDLGFLFIARAWSPYFNFNHGRSLSAESRALVQETPSGRRLVEARARRRVHRVSYENLSHAEVMKIFDMGQRADVEHPVLFVPDQEDLVNLSREAFPANFGELPAVTFGEIDTRHAAPLFLKEIIA